MDIEVKMNEVMAAQSNDILVASGVGSCLIITLYDPKQRIGALAHAMLPSRSSSFVKREAPDQSRDTLSPSRSAMAEHGHASRDTRYADTAIDEMLRRLAGQGAKRKDLEAKLVGGANMFSAFKSDIGRDNVLSAKEKLKKEGIKLMGESVGGSQGRSVEFSVASGIVTVKTKF